MAALLPAERIGGLASLQPGLRPMSATGSFASLRRAARLADVRYAFNGGRIFASQRTDALKAQINKTDRNERVLREQIAFLHRRLLAVVRGDDVCRRLMTTPGVGPVVALTYRATVDVPARFRKSKSVGAVFGLTCAKYQSGEIDWSGRISRCGDEMMRVMLYEAAQSMLRSKKWSWLKAWAMQIARRCGMKKAIVALARRLAVILHRIWVDGTEFRWTREQATAAA